MTATTHGGLSNGGALLHNLFQRSKISDLENTYLSQILAWSSPLICLFMIIYNVIVYNWEKWLLRLLYPIVYDHVSSFAKTTGTDRKRKSFTYHHLACTVKVVLICSVCYSVLMVLIGPHDFTTSIVSGSVATHGDFLLTSVHMYCGYYAWELSYRSSQASPSNMLHHFGLIVIGQIAAARCANPEAHQDTLLEFYMCLVWGAFDLVSELPVHVAMILHRVKSDSHRMLYYLLFFCVGWCISCTMTEIAFTIYLLYDSWDRWESAWHYVTPIVFSIWCFAQLYSTKQLYGITISEKIKWHQSLEEAKKADVESGNESGSNSPRLILCSIESEQGASADKLSIEPLY
ncbi:uncharacterized protein BCR38DRAFT_351360 [Pseudomassariella vexata]|uniref:TLC domain-domain-containing protein n=1 Tax=Pseudomassariella vexata TaxID=1141098 RepID=A0A1Y2DK60_9PEZI|nr:uncharacterized protein BCR38DRAFT_351360 [Pseudomassariella vexata]ORY59668.1 hypothetical protein BCR38DRAFT_351360 [Pseudomassariella vexata]